MVRITAMEARIAVLEQQDITTQEMAIKGFDVLSDGNEKNRQSLQNLSDRMSRENGAVLQLVSDVWGYLRFLSEKFAPVFARVFPKHAGFQEELRQALQQRRSSR